MIEFGPFRYDPEARFLYRGDREIRLPPRVLAVLESLLKRPGKVVPKEDVLASAWEGAFVGEDSLTQAVSQLRQALGDDPQRPTYIQTVPRRGYRFIAEVSEPLQGDRTIPEPTSPSLDQGSRPGTPVSRPREKQARSGPEQPRSAAERPLSAPQQLRSTEQRPLSPGTMLGNYQLVDRIGAGAMGEVWRARDAELGRDVAIKVVPPELAHEAAAMERFRREARLLAAVDHPNIATIYAVEEADGVRFIIMELLDGETLRKRLERGPLPLDEALNVACQVAEALESAHARDIIHRDLKPENVVLGPGDRAKVLDFGLAKQVRRVAGSAAGDASIDGTSLTKSGLLIGTAPYMSPEQARGEPLDKRTDVWAFGCLLYELLTGRRAFERAAVADTVAAILDQEPDWQQLPKATAASIRRLLRRCLSKDRSRRLHAIADARIEIEEAMGEPSAAELEKGPATIARGARWPRSPWVAAGIAAIVTAIVGAVVAVVAFSWMRLPPLTPEPVHFSWSPPDETIFVGAHFSPDGSRVVYSGGGQLNQRLLASDTPDPIPGTDGGGGYAVAFSPNGDSIAFIADQELKIVSLEGGPTETLRTMAGEAVWGISWGRDGNIYAALEGEGIVAIDTDSGDKRLVVAPNRENGEQDFYWPEILPDSQALLFNVWSGARMDDSPIVVFDLDTDDKRIVVKQGTYGKYHSGFIFYSRRTTLHAVEFDPNRLDVTGTPFPVPGLESIRTHPSHGFSNFGLSEQSGSLAYVATDPSAIPKRLLWVDRAGNDELLAEERREFMLPRVSPDGERLAVSDEDGVIWIYDLLTAQPIRLTTEGYNIQPVWTANGERVAFSSNRDGGTLDVYWKSADGEGEAQPLITSDNVLFPVSFSPGGRFLAFGEVNPETNNDIHIFDLKTGTPSPFLNSRASELAAQFAPGGDWLVYQSDESGFSQIYVKPFPGPGPGIPLARGSAPLWGPDGSEIFYRRGIGVFAGVFETGGQIPLLHSQSLMFEGRYSAAWTPDWDVSNDGQRFVMILVEDPRFFYLPTHVILNWFEDFKARLPPDR